MTAPASSQGALIPQAQAEIPEEVVSQAIDQTGGERREELFSVLISHEHHSGPLPSPKSLAGYELVSPGLANRIVEMAERQQQHDLTLENSHLKAEVHYRNLCVYIAGLVVLAFIGAAVWCAWLGQTKVAIAFATAPD